VGDMKASCGYCSSNVCCESMLVGARRWLDCRGTRAAMSRWAARWVKDCRGGSAANPVAVAASLNTDVGHHRRSSQHLHPHPSPPRHHEAVLGPFLLVAVLHSFCSKPRRQPGDRAPDHRPEAGPIAIPLDRTRRRRGHSTHQRVRGAAAEAVWRRRCRPIKGASAGVDRG
jgi:IS5 family transposase